MNITDVRFVLAAPTWNALPEGERAEVAFVGRSNVGKSSLLNALAGRRALARTSSTPGKTQTLNFYLANAEPDGQGGLRGGFFLVDVPGYGYAKVAQAQRAAWQRLVGRYVTERPQLRAVVQLIDSRHAPTALDEELIALLRESGAAHLIALTKADKLSGNGRATARAALERHLAPYGLEVPVVLTSAEKRDGIAELRAWIGALL
ncbi:MAG: ribosome biogenesis GTP-binding protein YihA/YsxC [Rubricoccaceae bacterium]